MNLAARLTACEATIAKLAVTRGPKVSDMLRAARQQAIAGEVELEPAYDIAALEAEAKLPGVRGELARAQLRLAGDALLPPA